MCETLEEMRTQLNNLLLKFNFDFNNKEIIELSEKLDEVICNYYKFIEVD